MNAMIYAKWIYEDGRFSFSLEDNGGAQITDELHRELLSGESAGMVIVADNDGYPILADQEVLPPQVPQKVTMRQARLALHVAGLLDQVETAIDALPEPTRTEGRIEWDYASEVHRGSEFVGMMGAALSLNEEALDALFVAAAGL